MLDTLKRFFVTTIAMGGLFFAAYWSLTQDDNTDGHQREKDRQMLIRQQREQERIALVKSMPTEDWWVDTDKYKICYANVTATYKANGLHYKDRERSIKLKEQICKIAATSKTGEGCAWINEC